ncbi:MAG: TIGR02302 family protein [Rhodobacteraceae bacterium]|nr:TIGR02302 family protein [Paracoccaceae bacterium]
MAKPPGTALTLRRLRLPLALTRVGMIAEQVLRQFWPLFSILMLVAAALILGLHDLMPIEVVWGTAVVSILAMLVSFVRGFRRFHWPTRLEALSRLDETLLGRPIAALLDEQAIGAGDDASAAVWRAHQQRMAAQAYGAKAAKPNLRIANRDPYGLRYSSLVALIVALMFGSILRVGTVTELTPGGAALAAGGPSWEGWIEPPRYTGLPTLYLNDIIGKTLSVPQGSRITLRFYGELGALTLAETVSGRIGDLPAASDPVQEFSIAQDGELRIDGVGGQTWSVAMIADSVPKIAITGEAEAQAGGQMTLPFTASDDYGVVSGTALIALDLDAINRRYGLLVEPEARNEISVELPMPISGDRRDFTEKLIEDFSQHPWANLPVIFKLQVEDAAGHSTASEGFAAILPARRFFDPMAAAIIEQRRDLLWSRANAPLVAQILRAISHRPEGVFRSEIAYLRLRVILRRLETMTRYKLKVPQRDEISKALWDLAILLEDGDIGDALERLRRAQEQLTEAMRNGASDQEIAELMQELRRASDDYMRQLSQQAQENGEAMDDQNLPENSMQMTQSDLQKMMDRIQELMEQGRMAEAEQALQELQELMENMRITNAPGQSGQSEGEQAMEGLADTLREQQGLSDQAFRDLQEQFNPNAQAGESQGNEGRNGGQGRGQSHEGQGGRGQGNGDQEGQQEGGSAEGSLADRQQALRDELNRQQGNMPGAGTPEGEAARDALKRAGEAMDGAEEALRQNDYAGAIDQQSEAMEALRDGMRSLGEAMAQTQQNQQGQGEQVGDLQSQNRDPLGRNRGSQGSVGTDESLLQGEDVYRRARELLDEIRRRSGEGERPEVELDYLQRLLDRF